MKKVVKIEKMSKEDINKILKKRSLIDVIFMSGFDILSAFGIIGLIETNLSTTLLKSFTIISYSISYIFAFDHLNCENKLTKDWFYEFDKQNINHKKR